MHDVEQYLINLEQAHPLREPVIRTAVESLRLPEGSCGLDIGCGIGLYTLLLAEAVGSAGHVTGLDITKELLGKARFLSSVSSMEDIISFQEGDARELPFDSNVFDWACSMDFAGYISLDPVLLLKEMGRVVKPRGKVHIIMWSSQMLLPGFPMLESRLNATLAGIAPFSPGMKPESHSMRALGLFHRAGLAETEVRTFVRTVCPPLSPEIRTALTDLLQMRWEEAYSEVAPEDWAQYQHLCRNDSLDFILNIPDYYAFFTYSLFSGTVL